MSDEPQVQVPGLTILGRYGLGLRLVSDRVASWEWQSHPRRDPVPAHWRLAPLRPWRYIPKKEDRR
jgi:hypothetical protein